MSTNNLDNKKKQNKNVISDPYFFIQGNPKYLGVWDQYIEDKINESVDNNGVFQRHRYPPFL